MRVIMMALLASIAAAHAEDVLLLTDGTTLRGEIVRYLPEATQLRITKQGASGVGSTVRTISNAEIRFIDFARSESDERVLKAGDLVALNTLWNDRKRLLDRPKSNAGAVGMRLAEAHFDRDTPVGYRNARDLYAEIEAGDWDDRRRSVARRARLKTLIAMGDVQAAMAEAKAMEAESEDPELLLDARHVLAVFDFQKLEKLIEENPRWREDDTVRDDIRKLYHGTVDRFLHPYLFYGSEERAAARGLLHAAKTHVLVDRGDEARACADDILKLYAKTEFAAQAKSFVETKTPTTTND